MVTSILLFVSVLFIAGDPPKKEPEKQKKDVLKSRLVELDKLFKDSMKSYAKEKTSARKDMAYDQIMEDFDKWAESIDEETWTFNSRVSDVIRRDGKFSVDCECPKILKPFSPGSNKPVTSVEFLSIEIPGKLEQTLKVGDTVQIRVIAKIVKSKSETKPKNTLISIFAGCLQFADAKEAVTYDKNKLHYYFVAKEISIVE